MTSKRTLLKALAAAAMATVALGSAHAADITGAGATFPFPIYAKWAEMYKAQTGTGMNYQSIGSSGGMRQIRAKTVTFGATDAPISGADLDKDAMVQFPAIIGGTVPVFNLPGFEPGSVRISGPVLAEMFLGKISTWNDPKIAALNPGKTFPNTAVTVVHRADGSGTTFNFTDYLNTVSKDWADKVGKGAAVKWPAETSVGGRGNEGVAANVSRTRGAIGYVMGEKVSLVSSDDETANVVYRQLVRGDLIASPDARPTVVYEATGDSADEFRRLANRLMGGEVRDVQLVQTGVIDLQDGTDHFRRKLLDAHADDAADRGQRLPTGHCLERLGLQTQQLFGVVPRHDYPLGCRR